jgi:hypothetical protein
MPYELDQRVCDQLEKVGYTFVKDRRLDPTFAQEMAVREFQIAASLSMIARFNSAAPDSTHYIDKLASVANPDVYVGKPHGHPDDRTRSLLTSWVSRGFRCPLVVAAFYTAATNVPDPTDPTNNSKRISWRKPSAILPSSTDPRFCDPARKAENLFLFDSGQIFQHLDRPIPLLPLRVPCFATKAFPVHFFARDFSQQYAPQPQFNDIPHDNGRILIGQYDRKPSAKVDKHQDGPLSIPFASDTWLKVTPETLTGKPYVSLTSDEQICYRVARAVCQAECLGFFDCLTAYDRAYISLGLCHWAFFHFDGPNFKKHCLEGSPFSAPPPEPRTQRGELEAFLAYVKHKYSVQYTAAFGRFGIEPSFAWFSKDAPHLPPIAERGTRRYTSSLSEWRYIAADNVIQLDLPRSCQRFNFLRSWHVFYRLQMAMRVFPEVRLAAWNMIRFRMRDISQVVIPADWGLTPESSTKPLTIGAVFNSEQNIAFLLQAHIFAPGSVLVQGAPTEMLRFALQGLPSGKPPSKWSEADQMGIQLRLESGKNPSQSTQSALRNRIRTICAVSLPSHPDDSARTRLSPFRASFRLADQDLDPPPPWNKPL